MTMIPEALASYLSDRDQQRATRVTEALNALTDRERALFQEAAVMGWVQGFQQARAGADSVGDFPKTPKVVAACLSMPDLYPTISRHTTGEDANDD